MGTQPCVTQPCSAFHEEAPKQSKPKVSYPQGSLQHKQARLRPTGQTGETQELPMLDCTFFSGQVSGTLLKAEPQQRSFCTLNLTGNTPFASEQSSQVFVWLKNIISLTPLFLSSKLHSLSPAPLQQPLEHRASKTGGPGTEGTKTRLKMQHAPNLIFSCVKSHREAMYQD